MRLVVEGEVGDIDYSRFEVGMRLADILKSLNLLDEEVICIDRKNKKLLLLSEKLKDDSDWEIRRIISQG